MNVNIEERGKRKIAVIESDEQLITDVQSALDLIATVRYDAKCFSFVLYKNAIIEKFFDLSTKLAGDILQKFQTYGIKLAIVGDFSQYESQALKDFIYECNKGRDFFFVSELDEALDRLA